MIDRRQARLRDFTLGLDRTDVVLQPQSIGADAAAGRAGTARTTAWTVGTGTAVLFAPVMVLIALSAVGS